MNIKKESAENVQIPKSSQTPNEALMSKKEKNREQRFCEA